LDKVICIVGPTASGKTSLSVELAKKINGEIISADSMQIYKYLNIGTAKVKKDEMQGITHHMIDIVSPEQDFSVADFKKMCYEKIEDILQRGKTPIIVGGTGLYVSSVILNMNFEDQEIDEEYRDYLYKLAEKFSNEYVHNILKEVDERSANEIHPNNLKRVIRALEMYKLNKPKSEHMDEEKDRINNIPNKYDFKLFCLKLDKEVLHERIDKRVDQMISEGLEEEARLVYKLSKCTAKQAVGYKEFFEYFENKIDLAKVIQDIKLKTRQYAKRQMTWFKKMPNVIYIDANLTKDKMIEEIVVNTYEK
jgi:tRNA dimethylallyltransferase